MIEFVVGIYLCWFAWFIGDKVKRRTASRLPASQKATLSIWIIGNISVLIGAAGLFYGFVIYPWWIPVVTLAVIPFSGSIYAIMEGFLSIAILSVPACGLVGAILLWKALL